MGLLVATASTLPAAEAQAQWQDGARVALRPASRLAEPLVGDISPLVVDHGRDCGSVLRRGVFAGAVALVAAGGIWIAYVGLTFPFRLGDRTVWTPGPEWVFYVSGAVALYVMVDTAICQRRHRTSERH